MPRIKLPPIEPNHTKGTEIEYNWLKYWLKDSKSPLKQPVESTNLVYLLLMGVAFGIGVLGMLWVLWEIWMFTIRIFV